MDLNALIKRIHDGLLRPWLGIAAGYWLVAGLVLLIGILVLLGRRSSAARHRRGMRGRGTDRHGKSGGGKTLEPSSQSEVGRTVEGSSGGESAATKWSLANLQGIGARDEQQDAFGMSRVDGLPERLEAVSVVLADGMGGVSDGGWIARTVVEQVLDQIDPAQPAESWLDEIDAINRQIYRQYREQGGTTLIFAHLQGDQLHFVSVGDSLIYLLRDGQLVQLNRLHEYADQMLLRAIRRSGAVDEISIRENGSIQEIREASFRANDPFPEVSVRDVLGDPEAGALSAYIGAPELEADYTILGFPTEIGDTLLFCSDGISDSLGIGDLSACLAADPVNECCRLLEEKLLVLGLPHQDNYTAIVARACA